MKREIVPEMHDLLKLTRLKHDFSDFTFQDYVPNTRTWQGVIQHHISERFPSYPVEPETFILCLADSLAASISRPAVPTRLGKGRFQVYKLWNPPKTETDPRLTRDEDIIKLLDFCSKEPSAEDYFKIYGDLLRNRNEDANPGRNVTSLYTHSKLTGQFYRIMMASPEFKLSKRDLWGKERETIQRMLNEFQNKWKLTVCKCKLHFPQNPIRARDLNVFAMMDQLLEEIERKYSDNILFKSSDELLLISADKTLLDAILENASEKGYWAEIVKATRGLSELKPEPKEMSGAKWENRHPNLPDQFEPPICEVCQMAKATKHWVKDYILENRDICDHCRELVSMHPFELVKGELCEKDKPKLADLMEEQAQEDLCDNCYAIRASGIKLTKLKEWTEAGSTKIAWIKIKLDFENLILTLKKLYLEYLRSFDESITPDKAEIRFSLVSEFQEDYNTFLNSFFNKLKEDFSPSNIEQILSDLCCVKINGYSDELKALRIYNDLLMGFFPMFKKLSTAPLKFISVCCDAKFPFYEVWRIIEEARDNIHIALTGHGEIKTTNQAIDLMLIATEPQKIRKSALHHLAEVAKISEKLAQLRFEDKSDKDYKTYSRLKEFLPMGMDFQSILTFSKLVGD